MTRQNILSDTALAERFAHISTLLDFEAPSPKVRRKIHELIEASIQHFTDNLDYWEKFHIGSAINNLASNLSIGDPKSMTCLRLCLMTLAMAFVPQAERDEALTPPDPAIDRITADDLLKALQTLQRA